ncbi:microsomal signal peptidase 12 kDa subunit-domain-containing protein [Cladochytrium replicatum]|nr:microsomal signal peptidase 12 kDa subunit-domain-containing protein [Cladochytrium replicatum]
MLETMDFEGQRQAELVCQVLLWSSGFVGLVVGYALQSIRVVFGCLGIGTALSFLLLVPGWPVFNRHPVKWLPKIEDPIEPESDGGAQKTKKKPAWWSLGLF